MKHVTVRKVARIYLPTLKPGVQHGVITFEVVGVGKSILLAHKDCQRQVRSAMKGLTYDLRPVAVDEGRTS